MIIINTVLVTDRVSGLQRDLEEQLQGETKASKHCLKAEAALSPFETQVV
jgi:hypothetical protein